MIDIKILAHFLKINIFFLPLWYIAAIAVLFRVLCTQLFEVDLYSLTFQQ